MSKLLTFLCLIMMIQSQSTFRDAQRQHARVDAAYNEKEATVREYFSSRKIGMDNFSLFIRAFKKEMTLEVWVKPKNEKTYVLLHTYDFCSTSGTLGPKRKEGDKQIPEGVYHINHFNPESNFHLSLGINYPNELDKILSDKKRPGGLIYIHGNCVTVGCIPITDGKIKELYILAVEAKSCGQQNIPVHIFPAKLNNENFAILCEEENASATLVSFWKNLQVVFNDFEKSKTLKPIGVTAKGGYYLVD